MWPTARTQAFRVSEQAGVGMRFKESDQWDNSLCFRGYGFKEPDHAAVWAQGTHEQGHCSSSGSLFLASLSLLQLLLVTNTLIYLICYFKLMLVDLSLLLLLISNIFEIMALISYFIYMYTYTYLCLLLQVSSNYWNSKFCPRTPPQ